VTKLRSALWVKIKVRIWEEIYGQKSGSKPGSGFRVINIGSGFTANIVSGLKSGSGFRVIFIGSVFTVQYSVRVKIRVRV
jgi:hypothetical protein